MREYKFYLAGSENGSWGFEKFAKEVTDSINADPDIIEKSKETNRKFTEQVKEILSDEENNLYVSTMIAGLESRTPRFMYRKNLEYNGKKYEAEIDLLHRKVFVVEV